MDEIKRRGRGRPKGAKNILSGSAKENIVAVFTRLGGTVAMCEWAKANQTEFYKIYGRLLPIEANLSGADGGPLQIVAVWKSAQS
jgi:hypothetical protein